MIILKFLKRKLISFYMHNHFYGAGIEDTEQIIFQAFYIQGVSFL